MYMIDEAYENYLKGDRELAMQKIAYLFVIFCHREGFIDDEELLHIYSFLHTNNSGDIKYLLFPSDEREHRNAKVIIDLRPTIKRMRDNRHKFDWGRIEGYI